MRLPLSWLKEFVTVSMTPTKLAERLTMAGHEVTDILSSSPYDQHFVVGKAVSIRPHPNADKLRLVTVDLGNEQKEIVCGAPNVAVGQTVAVVLVGGTLPNGLTIEARPIRGVISEGMICAEDELGRGTKHDGILVLPSRWPAGTPLANVFPGQDVVLDLDLTPQRGDCYSIYGLAREVAALTGKKLKAPSAVRPDAKKTLSGVSVSVSAKHDVPQYALRRVTGVTMAPSPTWAQERLLAAGIRPINAVVDATNYVMLELGQPLHAFDATQVVNRHLDVRYARAGETMVTLDGVTRTLMPEMIVIADAARPLALAGIMGGQGSGIKDSTAEVLLEAAVFDAVTTRRTASALRIRTESSHRFEKGIDDQMVPAALDRAATLMAEWTGGTVMPGTARYGRPVPARTVSVSASDVAKKLGMPVTAATIKNLWRD